MRVGERTYLLVGELYKSIAPRFPPQRPRLMEEEIEFGDLAKLGKGLQECVSMKGVHEKTRQV